MMEVIAMVLLIWTDGHAAAAVVVVQSVPQIFRQCVHSLCAVLEGLITAVIQPMYALNRIRVYECVETLILFDRLNNLENRI